MLTRLAQLWARRPLVHVGWADRPAVWCVYHGWGHPPALVRVGAGGVWLGVGMDLTVGWLVLRVQIPTGWRDWPAE